MTRWDGDEGEDDDEELMPGDPDYELSEAHGYLWYPESRRWFASPAVLALLTVLVIIALVLPGVLIMLRYR